MPDSLRRILKVVGRSVLIATIFATPVVALFACGAIGATFQAFFVAGGLGLVVITLCLWTLHECYLKGRSHG